MGTSGLMGAARTHPGTQQGLMSTREGKVPDHERVVSKCYAGLIRQPGEPPVWLCARGRL